MLEDINDERDVDNLFGRLPRVNSLDPGQRAVARELVQWREDIAQSADRPASTVLNEAALIELAKRRPATIERLTQIRGINEGTLRRRGKSIIEAIERGRAQPPIPVEGERPPASEAADGPLVALAEALVRARAMESDVAYELIAARADLQRIVTAVRERADEPDVRTLQGWRRELVGAELLDLLDGRRSLRIGPGRRIAIDN